MQRYKNLLNATVLATLLLFIPAIMWAQSSPFAVLHSFSSVTAPVNATGSNPRSPLLLATNGNYYGLAYGGGANGTGMIYELSPAGVLLKNVSFPALSGHVNSLGANPTGSLIDGSDGALYGCTANGGKYGAGVVFRCSLGGNIVAVASLPAGLNGQSEHATIIEGIENTFYVTAATYGPTGMGAIFSFTTALNNFSLLAAFASDGSQGSVPLGQPVQLNTGDIYGVASQGGANGLGAVYHLALDGTLFLVHSFAAGEAANPANGLALEPVQNIIYGTSAKGGTGNGCIYSITPTGVFTDLYSFSPLSSGTNTDGVGPVGTILDESGILYGVTTSGGTSNDGTLFSFNVQTLMFNVIHTFTAVAGRLAPDGGAPLAGVIADSNGDLFGTCSLGGVYGQGEVFEWPNTTIPPLPTVPTDLYSFYYLSNGINAEGNRPKAGLVEISAGVLEGTSYLGGGYGVGTLYKINSSGTSTGAVSTVHAFGLPNDGRDPAASLTKLGSLYYGCTPNGGTFNDGTIFSISSTGIYKVLYNFNGTTGMAPLGALCVGPDGNLYGTTSTGTATASGGTLFKITPAGVFTWLYSFGKQNYDGTDPQSGLFLASDGNLYGTTWTGGSYNLGTVYKVTLQPFAEQVVYAFGAQNNGKENLDGAYPAGPLMNNPFGSGLMGVTTAGGANNYGSVFVLNGSVLTSFYTFAAIANGVTPVGCPVLGSDKAIYGLTSSGGAHGLGCVYRINNQGVATVPPVYSFSGPDGQAPIGSLLLGSDKNFYGVTNVGGQYNEGTVFRLYLDPVPVISALSPSSVSVLVGGFTLTVLGSGFTTSSSVSWNGTAVTTTYVSPTQIKAVIPAALDTFAGNYSVSVYNPPPGGSTSNTKSFSVTNPVPVLTSITPTSVKQGGNAFLLTAIGTGFEFNSQINWNGEPLVTNDLSNSTLTAAVPASMIARSGVITITVTTPLPGGGASAGKSLVIIPK